MTTGIAENPVQAVSRGFGDEQLLRRNVVCRLRDLETILENNKPDTLEFDLTDVVLCTSEVLAFLLSLTNKGVKVVLLNASEDVRNVVETLVAGRDIG